MTGSGSGKRPSMKAEEAFADYVMRRERGDQLDFEGLCSDNPELEEDLRRLHGDWNELETVCRDKLGSDSLVHTMLARGGDEGRTAGAGARAIFSEYLVAREDDPSLDFEALCSKHPELTDELRELHTQWIGFEQTMAAAPGLKGSLNKTFLLRHGRDPLEDPQWEAVRSDLLIDRLLQSREQRGHGYTICGEVARGGMGAILKVWDPNLRRNLAMKVIHEGHNPTDLREESSAVNKILARFLEEAQVTGQLDHPGIVPVYNLGVDDGGRCYFTMRLVRGRELLKIFELVWAEKEEWNTTRALGVLLRVCDAMSYAHSKNVLHRDLKPANIMVGRFGETYVMDWGLARVLGKNEAHDIRPNTEGTEQSIVQTDRAEDDSDLGTGELHTMDGDVIGTPSYMPPEQARGELDKIGKHTDVYSIGAMLYHLLTKRAPYTTPPQRLKGMDVWRKVLAGPPTPIEELTTKPPAELVAICEKAMAREPQDRYADTHELSADLRAFLEGRVVRAYETGPVAEFRKFVGRNKAVAAALFSTVSLVVIGLVALNAKSVVEVQEAQKDVQKAEQIAVVAVDDKDRAVKEKEVIEQQKQEIEASRKRAELHQKKAEENEEEARQAHAKVLRLADGKRLQQLVKRGQRLWPAVPEMIPSIREWLVPAVALAESYPTHLEALTTLRKQATPSSNEQLAADRKNHPRAEELRGLADSIEELKTELADQASEPESDGRREAEEELQRQLQDTELRHRVLRSEIQSYRQWNFEDPEAQWHHDLLAELVASLEQFRQPKTGLIANVEKRIELANTVRRESVERYAVRWTNAIASIADRTTCPDYNSLVLTPQMGLVPLARNRDTGLWEFVDVSTGTVPEVGPEGTYKISEESGAVFVLIPGAMALLGSQPPDRDLDLAPGDPNTYRFAWDDEGPIHRIEIAPFFMGKHEFTQGQWLRATSTSPSRYGPVERSGRLGRDLTHPVENISWYEAEQTLTQLGLRLPTEAQWEYAARAGSTTPWWQGPREVSLDGKSNLADQYAEENEGPEKWAYSREVYDGYLVHGPVDSLAPNKFGLFHVSGNVVEWCLDGYKKSYSKYMPAVGTGYRDVPAPEKRVARGGGFSDVADSLRTSYRESLSPDDRKLSLGVRAARAIRR